MIVDCMTICFAPPSSNATNATSPANPTPAIGNACEACINDNQGKNFLKNFQNIEEAKFKPQET